MEFDSTSTSPGPPRKRTSAGPRPRSAVTPSSPAAASNEKGGRSYQPCERTTAPVGRRGGGIITGEKPGPAHPTWGGFPKPPLGPRLREPKQSRHASARLRSLLGERLPSCEACRERAPVPRPRSLERSATCLDSPTTWRAERSRRGAVMIPSTCRAGVRGPAPALARLLNPRSSLAARAQKVARTPVRASTSLPSERLPEVCEFLSRAAAGGAVRVPLGSGRCAPFL